MRNTDSEKIYSIPDEFLTDAEEDSTTPIELSKSDLSNAFELADKLQNQN